MMTKQNTRFQVRCDVCGYTEHFEAGSHSECWHKMKRAGWTLARDALPIVHVGPECNPYPEALAWPAGIKAKK